MRTIVEGDVFVGGVFVWWTSWVDLNGNKVGNKVGLGCGISFFFGFFFVTFIHSASCKPSNEEFSVKTEVSSCLSIFLKVLKLFETGTWQQIFCCSLELLFGGDFVSNKQIFSISWAFSDLRARIVSLSLLLYLSSFQKGLFIAK